MIITMVMVSAGTIDTKNGKSRCCANSSSTSSGDAISASCPLVRSSDVAFLLVASVLSVYR